jgi:hypothetical protein
MTPRRPRDDAATTPRRPGDGGVVIHDTVDHRLPELESTT